MGRFGTLAVLFLPRRELIVKDDRLYFERLKKRAKNTLPFDIWEKWGRHIWEKGVLGFFTSIFSLSSSSLPEPMKVDALGCCIVWNSEPRTLGEG